MRTTNTLVRLRPLVFIAILLVIWEIAARRQSAHLLPGPIGTLGGIADLVRHGLLLKYVVASLFRVTWGFFLAAFWLFLWDSSSAGIAGQK